MRKNLVKPTRKQIAAFEHLKTAGSLGEAMRRAGYSEITSQDPKKNFTDSAGFKVLVNQYKDQLKKAGVSTEILAKIQASGLFNEDPKIRLEYLKETKRDFGIIQPDPKVNIAVGIGFKKGDYV